MENKTIIRRSIYTDQERKERKLRYDIQYQKDRYRTDPEFRETRKKIQLKSNNKNKVQKLDKKDLYEQAKIIDFL